VQRYVESGWQYEKREFRKTATLGHRDTDGMEQQKYLQRQNERKIHEAESCVWGVDGIKTENRKIRVQSRNEKRREQAR